PDLSDDADARRAALDALDAAPLDWLVPGMREELVAGYIKTLPKVLRREVVPAGDWARRIVPELPPEPEGRFGDVLAATIKRLTFAPVTRQDFELERLADHLRMNVRLVDARGRTLAAGRDLRAMRATLPDAAGEPPHSSDRGRRDAGPSAPTAPAVRPEPTRATADEPTPAVRALIKYA